MRTYSSSVYNYVRRVLLGTLHVWGQGKKVLFTDSLYNYDYKNYRELKRKKRDHLPWEEFVPRANSSYTCFRKLHENKGGTDNVQFVHAH